MFNKLFKLRGVIDKKWAIALEISGLLLFLLIWQLISLKYPAAVLPSPGEVLSSFGELNTQDFLIENTIYSIKLNYWGYLEAVLIAVPIGYLIGLFPFFKHLANKHVDATRFIPLTAITGLFIAWFGIEDGMKIHFLAFGIIVYLLPVVVQRISEVEEVYIQTIHTLGGSTFQKIFYVFIPAVLSKLFDDIRVLVAISWTYIIVAEMINKEHGIGAMIFTAARQSRLDKVFAILLVIIMVGFLQDKLFKLIDSMIFKHKYQK
jgi:NitT/TauT family transport system permease protein